MEKKINMPKLAPEMESGVLCAWLKEEGDTVAAGEPLFEIETNKVVNQVEATISGVLKSNWRRRVTPSVWTPPWRCWRRSEIWKRNRNG